MLKQFAIGVIINATLVSASFASGAFREVCQDQTTARDLALAKVDECVAEKSRPLRSPDELYASCRKPTDSLLVAEASLAQCRQAEGGVTKVKAHVSE